MANLPQFDNPQKSMLSSILEGYKGFHAPMNMMQEQQQRNQANEQMRLANIFNQAREPYADELAQAEAQKARMNSQFGGIDLGGELGNIQKLYKLKQYLGEDHPMVKEVEKQLQLQRNSQRLRDEQIQSVNDYRALSQTPAQQKLEESERFAALGVPPLTATKLQAQGITALDYARSQGMSDEEFAQLKPKRATPDAIRTQIREIQGQANEEEYISKTIAEDTKDWPPTWSGYSPEQIWSAIKNNPKDTEKQARFLRARTLGQDAALLQNRIAQAGNSHSAVQDVLSKSLLDLKAFDPLVSKEVYNRYKELMHESIQEMVKARTKGLEGILNEGPKKSAGEKMYVIKDPRTGNQKVVPESQLPKRKG